MENNFNRRIPTDLDLNGPILAYEEQPDDQTKDRGDTAQFSVEATTTFLGNSGADGNDAGTIKYQWYEVRPLGQQVYDINNTDIILVDGTEQSGATISGATTNILQIVNVDTPTDSGRKFYCVITYTPGDEYDSANKGTGTALNEPLKSDIAELTVNQLLIKLKMNFCIQKVLIKKKNQLKMKVMLL